MELRPFSGWWQLDVNLWCRQVKRVAAYRAKILPKVGAIHPVYKFLAAFLPEPRRGIAAT
jgi:hypothetical protein